MGCPYNKFLGVGGRYAEIPGAGGEEEARLPNLQRTSVVWCGAGTERVASAHGWVRVHAVRDVCATRCCVVGAGRRPRSYRGVASARVASDGTGCACGGTLFAGWAEAKYPSSS